MNRRKNVAVVTGGAGFIGSHMVDLLREQDYVVRVIDNLSSGTLENLQSHRHTPEVAVEIADVCSLDATNPVFNDADYVFHFAGMGDVVPSIERPADYCAVNVLGTVRTLECARMAGVQKFVYAASSSCYGIAPEVPTPETAPIRPAYPYALSKYLGEQAVFHWGQVYRMPVVSLRIFNAYGPRSRTTGAYGAVFGVFLRQKLANSPYTVIGDGTQKRDFVFVSDVVRAFARAAQSDCSTGAVYNVGAGAPQSIQRLVALLGGSSVSIPWRPGEPRCTWADLSNVRRNLGWEPRVSFEEGVATVLLHLDRWREAPLWKPDTIAHATQTWFQVLAGTR